MRFEGRIRKDGKFWLVEIPAFDAVTQADAAPSARRARLLPAVVVTVVVVAAITGLVAWKGRTLLVRGGPPDALRPASLSSIGEAPSPSAEANEYFEKGLLFLRAQLDVPRAQKMLDRAIEIDPTFGSARAMRALTNVIAIHEGSANDGGLVYASERDIRDILASQPDLGSAHATLGATLLYLNRKEQARQELALALQLNPQSQPAVAWLMLDDRHSGRSEAAEARARGILEGVPLFWFARITLSDILFDGGRVDDAHREIEKVFEQDAANLAAVCAMVRIHLYQGDTRGARAMLEGIPRRRTRTSGCVSAGRCCSRARARRTPRSPRSMPRR